jgi:hypothetical protein
VYDGSIYSTVEKRETHRMFSTGPDQMETSKVVNKKRKKRGLRIRERESRILELLIQSQPFDWLLLKVGEKRKRKN